MEQNDIDHHAHRDFFELVVVKSGSGIHSSCGENRTISAGDVFLIPPEVGHSYTNTNGLTIYNILFSDGFFQQFGEDLSRFANYQLYFNLSRSNNISTIEIMHLDGESFASLSDLLEETCREQEIVGPGYRTAVFCNALKIMLLLCRHAKSRREDTLSGAVFSISRLLAELENSLDTVWTLEKMAKKCYLSVSSFRQQFKRFTGASPAAWLLNKRLERTAGMLKSSGEPISEIAGKCGFSDSNYFSRQFKKAFGVSPRDFRKNIS
jgi:AraC-like DNA-binding protein